MLLPILASVFLAKPGGILLIGSSQIPTDAMETFAEYCGDKSKPVVVLAQTVREPSSKVAVVEELERFGFKSISVETRTTFSDTDRTALEAQVEKACGVVVPEGDQSLFLERFGAAWCHRVFTKFLDTGGNWLGVKAGAALTGDPMFHDEKAGLGIGLLDAIVDYDYYAKHREIRLRNAYFGCRVQYGIGLNEGEWIAIRDGLIEKKVGLPQIFLREAM